jgi:hypothetical protein
VGDAGDAGVGDAGDAGPGDAGDGGLGDAGPGDAGDAGPGDAGDAGACGGSYSRQWVINQITLPASKTDYALDLNGDGVADNHFGALVGALSGFLSLQPNVDGALSSGTEVHLIDLNTSDPANSNDPCATSHLYAGKDRSDGGPLAIDPTVAAGFFDGPIASDIFTSRSPVTGPDVVLTFPLAFAGSTPLKLDLHAARITYHLAWLDAGSGLYAGQLNGAIPEAEFLKVFVPAVAAQVNAIVQADPSSSEAQQILSLFDVGNGQGGTCSWSDGSTGTSGDGIIAACEVGDNVLIKVLLAGDVQLFDDAGAYAPNAGNANPDSFSIGIGFSANPATF